MVKLEAWLAWEADLQYDRVAHGPFVADADVALIQVARDEVLAKAPGTETTCSGRVLTLPTQIVGTAVCRVKSASVSPPPR